MPATLRPVLDIAPLLVTVGNGLDALIDALPFDEFMALHPAWTKRNANPVKTQERISEEVARAAREWESLRRMRASMRFFDDAQAAFFKTLDMQAAIKANDERTAAQERVDAMERQREENERWKREQAEGWSKMQAAGTPWTPDFTEVEPEPAPIQEQPAETVSAPQRKRYRFEAWLDENELASFREWKNACNVGTGWTYREVG